MTNFIFITFSYIHTDKEMKTSEMPMIFKIYWSIHNTSMILSLLITLMYWTVIHTPEKPLDTTNFFTHACNSIFMFIDFVIVAHPIRLMHVVWPLLAGTLYGLFTLIYYLAGGEDPDGYPFIYPMMDWSKPGLVIPVVFGIMIFIVLLHTSVFWMYRLRVFVFKKYFVKDAAMEEERGQSNLTFKSESLEADRS